jgi:NAD(P)-dependent dehydrogenase (short-subunit alcohol dehydrogenase family)
MEIKNKNALITGGAVRVGRAITLAFARSGANVVINYHSSAKAAQQTCSEAEALGIGALAVQADVADPAQVEAMFTQVGEKLGGVDILVNAASEFTRTPVPTRDFAAWHRVTAIALDGPFYCANAAAPGMKSRGEGVIINIVDLSAWSPWPGFTAHSVGKAGLMALTKQLALELAPAIRVNAVAPGPVLPPPNFSQEQMDKTAQRTLLKRWGQPEDVSEAVLFLVRSNYITGEVIVVDGGERWGMRKALNEG